MSDEFASPFVAGARVAIQYGHSSDWTEGFVDKVYKTGKFTLRGDTAKPPQQWRPSHYRWRDGRPLDWSAHRTGRDRWSRTTMLLWDENADKRIQGEIAEARRRERFRAVIDRFRALHSSEVTDAMLDVIEAALPAVERREGK